MKIALTQILDAQRCGRRQDFLVQELNRESNILGPKSISTDTTQASAEIQVLIVQMREQVQSIEYVRTITRTTTVI